MNFDEMILEAAKSIAAATSALIKAASAAQRELIATGKVSRTPLTSSDDGQWSEGLISAARLVAAATHSLVESANALVQGVSSEEKLISSAKQVASSTAQLLVACKVKADPDSDSTKRLQAAGNAVKRATDNLVRAAQQAIQQEEERSLVLNKRMVGGIAQEINARTEVLRIERELEEARGRLTAIRQAKYKNKPDYSDTENDADQSGYDSYSTKTPVQSLNNSLDQVQSAGQQLSHIINDRQNLVSPEKVHSTQSTLERKLKDGSFTAATESPYGSLGDSRKYNIDRGYSPSFVTENSPAQYSSIERKINQECFDPRPRAYEGSLEGPFPPPTAQIATGKSPKSPSRKTFQDNSANYFDQSNYSTPNSDRFNPQHMSTFRCDKGSERQGIPQSQTFKNIESKVLPGGRIESTTTKIYTASPGKTSSTSNYETMEQKEFNTSGNDMSTFKGTFDNGSLEQKSSKLSTTQKITEKKTVTMTMSKHHESSTKSFRFEDK